MARRQRKAIRKDEYLAAALSLLLPYEERTALRRAKEPAKTILAMFSPDHIELHALGGADSWWNLHPTIREVHKEKSKRDTAIVAKVKRIARKNGLRDGLETFFDLRATQQRTAKKIAPTKLKSPWRGKQRIPSRPFPKAHRPMRSRPWPSPSP